MVQIPYIKIPSVRVGSIVPTSNNGTGGATPAPPTPIIFLTQWRMMGNSEVHGQEIWSCGEYNAIDGKYHILVQPLGGGIADIALDEPLRKVNDVADSIDFADGVGTLTRNIAKAILSDITWYRIVYSTTGKYRVSSTSLVGMVKPSANNIAGNLLCSIYRTITANSAFTTSQVGISVEATEGRLYLYDDNYLQDEDFDVFKAHIRGAEMIYALANPTTETIQVPQIEKAESYSCVISQSGKAVEWSSFGTE